MITLYTRSAAIERLFERLLTGTDIPRRSGNPRDWHHTTGHADFVLTSAASSRELEKFTSRCSVPGRGAASLLILNATEKTNRPDACDWAREKLARMHAAGLDITIVGADMANPAKAVGAKPTRRQSEAGQWR